jgi:hypothetical protein
MHLIVYTSHYCDPPNALERNLKNITERAKIRNPKRDITGLLFYHSERFLQILEGTQANLESLMTVIQSDPRHEQIERLFDSPISKRNFSKWNMDTFNLSADQILDVSELQSITQAYKHNLLIDSKVVTDFYRAMLKHKDN